MNYLYSALAALAILIGVEQFGEHHVRSQWDTDIAVRQGVAEAEAERNKRNLADLQAKYKKDIEYAKTQASKRAVADYLRTHGMLPVCPAVQPGASGQTDIPSSTDGAASQYEAIERFAARCIDDARKVEMCAEWAIREGLPVSD